MRPRRSDAIRRTWLAASAVLLGLVAVFALGGLGRDSLWQDEAHSAFFVALPWGDSIHTLLQVGVHPPLYFVALKLITGAAGAGEVALRLPSALAHLLGTAGLMWIVGRRAGPASGLCCGWFWGFHPMLLWYAREARPYALAACLAALATGLYFHLRARPSAHGQALLAVLLAAGLLTHYFFFLLIAGLTLLQLLDLRRRPLSFRLWVGTVVIAALPMALWLLRYFAQPEVALGIGWIRRPLLGDLFLTVVNLWSGYGGHLSMPMAAFGLCAGAMTLDAVRARPVFPESRSLVVLPVLIAAVWAISAVRPVYMDRYLIVLIPLAAVVVGLGGGRWWSASRPDSAGVSRARSTGLLVAALLGVGVLAGQRVLTDPAYAREDWRGLVRMLEESESEPGVFFEDPESLVPFTYYRSEPFHHLEEVNAGTCRDGCWRILRRPFTAPHAFSQAVPDPQRPWAPQPIPGCQVLRSWESVSGLAAEELICREAQTAWAALPHGGGA